MYRTILFVTAALFSVFGTALNADSDESCKLPTPVEKFSASLYTAILVTTDPNISRSLELSGGDASMKLYMVIKQVLEEYGLCNAEKVAFDGARPLATLAKLTFTDYWMKVAQTFGTVLYQNGLMDCDNAVSLSLRLYTYIKKVLQGLDKAKFESQMQGAVRGVVQLYFELGLNLQDITQQTSDEFASEFKSSDKCNVKTSSN